MIPVVVSQLVLRPRLQPPILLGVVEGAVLGSHHRDRAGFKPEYSNKTYPEHLRFSLGHELRQDAPHWSP